MYTEMALTARRFALTFAVAGIAALGSVALAPAASAAQDVPGATVEHTSHGNGPDAFVQMEHRKLPVFFCDADKPKRHHKDCIDLTAPTRF
ncbi:hypothetical protein E4P39_08340 [Blastococcus sp. CT_GayMR19]|uniref:hypothetical protein n=1 Tax=Blastococcus sp. CT_GayMR19 TaxID=2559608 RepID=UPI001073974B|nr:hypothetical protein [Blastococcus sp. CT_GayMR19]TFV76889.1 hypothetical protein E4P39_08340 [Blastococcus sp. CT_GayMR19]